MRRRGRHRGRFTFYLIGMLFCPVLLRRDGESAVLRNRNGLVPLRCGSTYAPLEQWRCLRRESLSVRREKNCENFNQRRFEILNPYRR